MPDLAPPTFDVPRGPQRWGPWLVALVALALRLFHLGHQSLWVDEIDTWFASSPFAPLTLADLWIDRHGPLVSAIVHAWEHAFGMSEFALRLPFALASALLVPAVAGLARRVAGPAAALPAAIVATLSPFALWYGQEARNYAFAFLWAALALTATLDYRARGRTKDLALLALWSVLGVLTNLNGALLLPVTFGALLVAPPRSRSRAWPVLLALTGVGLALSPWALSYFHVFELGRLVPGRAALPGEVPLRGLPNFSWAAIPYTFYAFAVGYTLGPTLRALHEHPGLATLRTAWPWILAVAALFGVLAARGLWALRQRRFELALLAGSFLVPAASVAYFALQNFKTFHPRYLGVALPGWFVLLSAGWVASGRAARRVLGCGVLALWAVALANHYGNDAYAKEDFRDAAAWLSAHAAPTDSLVVTGNYAPMLYYWRVREPFDRVPHASVFWLGYAADERLEPHFRPLLHAQGGTTWVVVSRAEDLDRPGRFEAWLRAHQRPEIHDWPGVRIYRLPGPGR